MRRHADVLLAAALVAAAQIELALSGDQDHRGVYVAVAGLVPGLVAIRRRAPMAALLTASAAFTAVGLVGLEIRTTAEVIAFVVLVFTAAHELPLRKALWLLAAAGAGLLAEAIRDGGGTDVAFVFLVFVVPPWLVGRAVRDRDRRVRELEAVRAALQVEQARAAELAVETERVRMAREMHDVLSHSVALIALQAGAGERLAANDPQAARDTLRTIAAAGRKALEELEDVLTDVDSPPGLERLAEGLRASGVEVELRLERAVPPPAAVALAAERIVQEALTNVVKHAAARRVRVVVRSDDDAVDVEVTDDGTGAGEGGGTGRGLLGMRERVAAYNGRLEAGPRPEGGYAIRARLPLETR